MYYNLLHIIEVNIHFLFKLLTSATFKRNQFNSTDTVTPIAI